MNKKKFLIGMMLIAVYLTGCGNDENVVSESTKFSHGDSDITDSMDVDPTDEIVELEEGLSVVRFEGKDGFLQFLENGGASSDSEVVE